MFVAGTIEVLEATPQTLRAMLSGLPIEAIDREGDGGWSPREVVIHLAARARATLAERVMCMTEEDCPALPALPHDVMRAAYALRGEPLDRVLDDFAAARADAMAVVRSLRPDQLRRRGVIPGAGEVDVRDVVHHIAFHDLVHIAQIVDLLSAAVEPERGKLRAFR